MINYRRDFPIFKQHGKLTYLDSAATSQKPYRVIDAVNNFYQTTNANVHRSAYPIAESATYIFEKTREKVAQFINAKDTKEVVFTKNTNEAINQVAFGVKPFISEGDIIVTTEMEHHANLVPWMRLARQNKARLEFIPLTPHYTLDYKKFILDHQNELDKVKIVALSYVSNVLGTINPIQKIIEEFRRVSPFAIYVVDAAQAVPHFKVDVRYLNCDFLAFSGHKMLAPAGTGVLWGSLGKLMTLEPMNVGSHMISDVTFQDYTPAEIPDILEVGTPNLEGVAGLGAAIDYLNSVGMDTIFEQEKQLEVYMLNKLKQIKGLTLYRNPSPTYTVGVFSFSLDGVHPHDVASILGEADVCVRAGHHCAMPLMQKLGVQAVTRASLYLYNNIPDIDRFAFFLSKVRKTMGYD